MTRRFPLADIVHGARMTQAVIAVNAALFLAMLVTGCQDCPGTARRFGALVIVHGHLAEPWRLVTSAFVHFGLAHLAANMFGLAIFGPDLERRFGRTRYVLLYLGAAVSGGLLTLALARGETSIAAGASGGVFGLMGGWLAVLVLRRRESGQQFLSMLLFIGIALGLGASDARVGTSAHAGGLAGGFVLGLVIEALRFARTGEPLPPGGAHQQPPRHEPPAGDGAPPQTQ